VPETLRQVTGVATWSTLLLDSFTANDNNWITGNRPSEYFSKLSQTIADGRYRWEGEVGRASSITTAWLTGYPVSDLHLRVNGKHIQGSKANSGWGLIFHVQDNQNYYWFRATDSQFFGVSVNVEGQWLTLIDWTRTDTIKPNGVNQLEVIAHDAHFTFLINGQGVGELDDDHFKQGLVGVAVEGYTPGEKITFDFLDFLLRAP
jgi:hypothetical protein